MPSTGNAPAFSWLETALSAGMPDQKPFLAQLQGLYSHMDHRYSELADRSGFNCRGCEDNCCRTLFYHHTLVEYLYIREGILALGEDAKEKVLRISRDVSSRPDAGLFCPLNENGRCLLYFYRPMICRLHGLAHELRRPDGTVHRGPGCAAFDAMSTGTPSVSLDRTGFYWELSRLEKEVRSAFGVFQKIRMTVSQMVEAVLESEFRKESFHEAN
jgi:Fe-S-cluster containining protein